jgi:hypothetical protein
VSINSLQEGQVLQFGNELFFLVVKAIFLYSFWVIKNYYTSLKSKKINTVFDLYFFYLILEIFFGLILSSNYWDYKKLVTNSMALFIPIVAYSADNIVFINKTFKFFIYKIAPLIIICIFFFPSERFGVFLAPFTFFLLFFPLVSTRWKTIFFLVVLVGYFVGAGSVGY